jgi:hypothetical protein
MAINCNITNIERLESRDVALPMVICSVAFMMAVVFQRYKIHRLNTSTGANSLPVPPNGENFAMDLNKQRKHGGEYCIST